MDKSIQVSLKTDREYPREKQYAVYRVSGSSHTYLGGEWINGRIQFYTKELGNFTLLRDTIAPTIRPVSMNTGTVSFRIKDNLSGVSAYKATINGQWLLMHYDGKSNFIWSERQDKTIPLKGEFVLEVTDNAGNKQVYQTTL
jgi:hypothetical protein